jgi:DNA-binding winged helix-turn-helix (wHTH) protein/TolB-like protein
MDKQDYRVGRFILQPFRQLSESGRPVLVKSKALAILSVLAEAQGALVTKDEIMAAVWPNIVVEDNAIQAHVASLRKILGSDAGLLCTVHGTGYRLAPTEIVPSAEAPSDRAAFPAAALAARKPISRFAVAALLVALVATATLSFIPSWTSQAPAPQPAQIAVRPFEHPASGPDVEMLANDLRHKIANDLTDARILVASGTDGDTSQSSGSNAGKLDNAEFLVSGRIKSAESPFEAQVQLSDATENVVIWSATFQEDKDAQTGLFSRLTTEVANVAHWAVIGRTGHVRLNAASVAAFVEARNSTGVVGRSASALEIDDYRKVIAAAPGFTWGHSGLAVAYAFQLRNDPGNEVLRNEALLEASRALELDPHNGEAYVARELLLPRLSWKQREELLLKGFDADPSFEPASLMEGRLLWSVGRGHDALRWFKDAYNTDPLHNNNSFAYAASLASEGYLDESRKLVAEMEARWPEQVGTKNARFWTSVISGATDDTQALLANPEKWPLGMNQRSAEAWHLALTAYASKDGSARTRAIEAINRRAGDGSLGHGEALLLFSMLNDVDDAFAEAQHYEPTDPRWGPFLFLGPTQAMRSDRRFLALAVRFGYASYWRSTDQWPDFCMARNLPYNCKAEVAKLAVYDPGLEPNKGLGPIAAVN